ncbi:MAG: LPS export ABC transporter permease LptF [Acidiferrobacter sp.]
MIIRRALYREATQTTLFVTITFLTLYIVVSLVKLLSEAANGQFPAHIVFVLLGLELLKNLAMILPLTVFIGLLLTMARWYRDNEITVLGACGVGLRQLLPPVYLWLSVAAVIIGAIAFYLAPLSALLLHKVKVENTAAYAAGIVPGRFNHTHNGRAIFYVQRIGHHGRLHDIFVSRTQFGKSGVLIAKRGYEYKNPRSGVRFLVLLNGRRYQGIPGEANYRILRYQTYALRIRPRRFVPGPSTISRDEVPTLTLLASSNPRAIAEWQWRLAQPLSLFVLAPLALVFAYTDSRRGAFAPLFAAVLIYFAYVNLLSIAHALLARGQISPYVGLWAVHIGFALFGLYLFQRRTYGRPLWPSWAWRR